MRLANPIGKTKLLKIKLRLYCINETAERAINKYEKYETIRVLTL